MRSIARSVGQWAYSSWQQKRSRSCSVGDTSSSTAAQVARSAPNKGHGIVKVVTAATARASAGGQNTTTA
jgi:hypothetical protein